MNAIDFIYNSHIEINFDIFLYFFLIDYIIYDKKEKNFLIFYFSSRRKKIKNDIAFLLKMKIMDRKKQ